jgi:hypothetical protein
VNIEQGDLKNAAVQVFDVIGPIGALRECCYDFHVSI